MLRQECFISTVTFVHQFSFMKKQNLPPFTNFLSCRSKICHLSHSLIEHSVVFFDLLWYRQKPSRCSALSGMDSWARSRDSPDELMRAQFNSQSFTSAPECFAHLSHHTLAITSQHWRRDKHTKTDNNNKKLKPKLLYSLSFTVPTFKKQKMKAIILI